MNHCCKCFSTEIGILCGCGKYVYSMYYMVLFLICDTLSCTFDVMADNSAFPYFASHLTLTALHKIPVIK